MEIGERTRNTPAQATGQPAPRLRVSGDRFAMLLILLGVIAATANPSVAFPGPGHTTSRHHHPPLLDCSPAPAASTHNVSSFRANLASALSSLPITVADVPERSAFLESVDAGPDHAFALGSSFGAPGDCLACLTAAATDVTRGCGSGSRRAGVWRSGCFLAYADTSESSVHEETFRGWFYAGPGTADCTRCLSDSLQAAPALGWLSWLRGDEVVVVGYGCFLGVQKLPYGQEGDTTAGSIFFKCWVLYMLLNEAIIIVLLFVEIIKTLQGG